MIQKSYSFITIKTDKSSRRFLRVNPKTEKDSVEINSITLKFWFYEVELLVKIILEMSSKV